jgi:hypothetical protein
MIFPSVTPVDVTSEKPVSFPTPQIVWPTMVLGASAYEEDDLNWFPDEDSYRERFRLGIGGAASRAFRESVRLARDRVWLLDEQLLRNDESRNRLWELFYETGAWDIRVVTASKEGALERAASLKGLEQDLQSRRADIPPRIQFFLNLSKPSKDMPEIHDRFAVVDNVLWHCGATIGGLHNAINAMTFGWSAVDTRAIAFFERVCKILGEGDV